MLANPWQFAPPVDAHEAYLVTELGNIFSIENQTVTSAPSQSVGNIAYNLMIQGALMETLDFDGIVLHGDVSTEAEREDLAEWVIIDPATKHAGAILDGTGASIVVPRFYSTYSYSNGHISELGHNPPVDLINIQGHKTVYGSVTETGVPSGMTFSGTGWSIAKLGPVAGGSYTIQGTVPPGASVQPISSPNDMLITRYDGSRYVLVDGGSFYANTNGKRAWDFGNGNDGYRSDERILPSEIDLSWFNGDPNPPYTTSDYRRSFVYYGPDTDTSDLDRKIIWKVDSCQRAYCFYNYAYVYYIPKYGDTMLHSHLPIYVKDPLDISFTTDLRSGNRHYSSIYYCCGHYKYQEVTNNGVVVINDLGFQYDIGVDGSSSDMTRTITSAIEVRLVLEHSPHNGYNKITKVAAVVNYDQCHDYTFGRCWDSSDNPVSLVRDKPIEATGSVTIKDTRPYDAHSLYTGDFRQTLYNPSDTYLLVKPGGNTVTIKGVSSNPQSDVIFGLSGAPADTYYSILVDGMTTYGKTTPSGSIVVMEGDITVSDYNVPGAITFYPNALKHADYSFGMVGFDLVNDATFRFGNSPLIHVPEEFVKIRAWADVYVTDVTLASSSDSVTLHYLSGQYDAGDIITVPYVKLYDNFRMTIDGQTTLPMNFTDVPRITS